MIMRYLFGSYSSVLFYYICLNAVNGLNLSDFNECKLSILGSEYAGSLSRTTSGYRCRYWDSLNSDSEKIYDESFIDGSKKLANEYCRNPTNDPKGPWCFTSNPNVKSETCNIPLCFYPGCRISSIGSEYGGRLSKSISGLDCKEWKIGAHSRKSKFSFPRTNFPSGNTGPENRSCRNPNGNPAGPWCWVNVNSVENAVKDGKDILVAELCDVPFCDEPDCWIFSNGRTLHHHFLSLTDQRQNLTFWLKPWLSNKWVSRKGEKNSRLFISTSPSPYSSGFELILPLFRGQMELRYMDYGEKRDCVNLMMGAEEDVEENYLVKKITSWNEYRIVWTQKDISVYSIYDKIETLQLVYETRDADLQRKHRDDLSNIKYVSFSGEPSLWGIPCDESKCPVHSIYDSQTYTWEILRKTATGFNIQFSVRSFGVVGIVLAPTPLDIGSRIKVEIGNIDGTFARIGVKSNEKSKYIFNEIKNRNNQGINLSYWEWKEFSLSIIGDLIQVHAITKDGILGIQSQTILEMRHKAARLLLWYSAYSSEKTVSLWTFYCSPEEEDEVPPALPPECVISTAGKASKTYIGYQRVTFTGKPCLPWVSLTVSEVLPKYNPKFLETDLRDARDFCRNPTGGPLGPWCFRIGEDANAGGGIVLHAEKCGVRLCRYAECRMSGLGTEYIGNLNRTLSGRECQRWVASAPHKVPKALMKSKLYADLDIAVAGSSCRNPSRNNAGPWCFTLDPNVAIDLCDVRDCARPEACTHLVRGEGKGRLLYVLPQWKTQGLEFWLKEWDPDLSDGLVFILSTLKEERYYKLVIGADDSQAVELHYKNHEGEKLLKKKRVHYVIPAGRWGGFWLRIGHGSLSFGYQGVYSNILFEWIHPDPNSMDDPFTPTYLTFSSHLGHTIGMSFHCSECHIERTSTMHFTKLLPIRRQEDPTSGNFTRLQFFMRGYGTALIPLMLQPGLGEYFAVTIGEKEGTRAYILSRTKEKDKSMVLAYASSEEKILHESMWTKITIEFNELLLRVTREKTVILNYVSPSPLLFYWFSVGSKGGEIIWAANCDPPDIDGPPVSGGWSEWSPWQCSVTCGGGVGRRTRQCNNPTPNVFGLGCEGSQVSEGPCNQFPCGTVSQGLVESIRDSLRSFQFKVVASEGESIWLHCGNSSTGEKLSKEALRQAPNSVVGWTKDGAHILNRSDVKIMDDFNIILNNVEPEDSGVYVCVLWPRVHIERQMQRDGEDSSSSEKDARDLGLLAEIENQKPLPMNVISVIVICRNNPQPTLSVRETEVVSLRCNAISLGLIYGDLKIKWMRNGKTWKDYGFTTPEAISDESFNAKKEDAGEWLCVVSQPDLEFTWFTNWIRLEVRRAPNFFNRLMEDKLTAPIFGHLGSETNVLLVFFLTIGLFVALVVALTVIIIRCRRNRRIR